ncbi:hypothetical protein [Actinorugispora endophytica]|uniref:Uncharacterized protein n=1 Tax=Actinorugispora endophytica TaxID=1605990 RepID=A0A4R6UV07_9ACTN|nr:hypothetical protein [Actinorugispora endophytica]TDQ49245.1 hypothetical protein EV190_11641 [Actinorugispora endophytica]
MCFLRVRTATAAILLAAAAGCASSGGTTGADASAEPLSPEARLVRDLGCTSCSDDVHVVPGLTYEDTPARLLVAQAELEAHPVTGATRTTRVFLLRDSDDEVLASNMNEAPTGFTPLPPADFDDSWHLAEDGTFFLLTRYSGVAGMQQVSWLRPDLPESIEGFGLVGPATAGQSRVEAEDLDGDGSVEVVGYLGDDNPEWAQRYVKFFHRFDPDSASYQPWRCSESTDGGASYPEPVTMYEAPCYEFGSGFLPWEEGE